MLRCSTFRIQPAGKAVSLLRARNKKHRFRGFLFLCAGLDSNQRSPKAPNLQSGVIDHSTTDAPNDSNINQAILKTMRFFILALATLALPAVALAAPLVGAIVPACGVGGAVPCQACDLVKLADNLLRFGVMFSVFAASVMFAYAGVLYVSASANKGNIDSAKNIFSSVFIGLLLVLGAWLIIDLGMRVFTHKPLTFWTSIQCETLVLSGNGISYVPNGNSQSVEPAGTGTTPPVVVASGQLTHKQAMDQLAAACTNNGACVDVTSTAGAGGVSGTCSGVGCTNLTGIRQTTIDQAISLSKQCGCRVTITGATEQDAGHSTSGAEVSHVNGFKIDIAPTPKIDSIIENNYTYIGTSGGAHGGPQYRDKCGNIYTKELGFNHWDIAVISKCGG